MQTQLGLNEINLIFLYNWVHYHEPHPGQVCWNKIFNRTY